jgi:hypothetical protein
MKKCPPGVICIENFTSVIFIIILFIVGYFMYVNYKNQSNSNHKKQQNNNQNQSNSIPNIYSQEIVLQPNIPYNNLNLIERNDVLLNPYDAPYKDERYLMPKVSLIPAGAVPINVSTNISAVDTNYRQLGIITPLNGTSTNNILPLMGRPLFTSRQKWQYYTISNQHNNVKLPVSVKGRSALTDYGVDEVFSGDTVYVEGYNDAFKVTVYENDTIKYLPFI